MKELAPTRAIAQALITAKGGGECGLNSHSTGVGQEEEQKEEQSAVVVGHISNNNIRTLQEDVSIMLYFSFTPHYICFCLTFYQSPTALKGDLSLYNKPPSNH